MFVWHMRDLGYNSTTPIYAASGLLSYGDSDSESPVGGGGG